MSAKLMGMVMTSGPRVSADRFMLVALADHANDLGGSCRPSVSLLARKCCVQIRAARATLRRLEDGGWITRQIGGGSRATRYQINVAILGDPGSQRPGGEVVSDRGVRSSTAYEPPIEPPLEPSSIQDSVGGLS